MDNHINVGIILLTYRGNLAIKTNKNVGENFTLIHKAEFFTFKSQQSWLQISTHQQYLVKLFNFKKTELNLRWFKCLSSLSDSYDNVSQVLTKSVMGSAGPDVCKS